MQVFYTIAFEEGQTEADFLDLILMIPNRNVNSLYVQNNRYLDIFIFEVFITSMECLVNKHKSYWLLLS